MVNTSKDDNPLVPSSMQSRSTLGDSDSSKGQAHKLSDLDMIIDQNVAPSPKAMCAELAHEHALEDLHKITDHTSEPNDPTKGPVFSANFLEYATQYEPRKPEE